MEQAVFHLVLESIPEDTTYDDFQELTIQFMQAYKGLRKKDEWFPCIGKRVYTDREGYGYGSNEHLLPSFFRFTTKFPSHVFVLYHLYQDSKIAAYRIQGDGLIGTWDFDGSKLPTLGGKATVGFRFKYGSFSLERDLSPLMYPKMGYFDPNEWKKFNVNTDTGYKVKVRRLPNAQDIYQEIDTGFVITQGAGKEPTIIGVLDDEKTFRPYSRMSDDEKEERSFRELRSTEPDEKILEVLGALGYQVLDSQETQETSK